MSIKFTKRGVLTKKVEVGEDNFEITFRVANNSGLIDFGHAFQISRDGDPILGVAIVKFIKNNLISWTLPEPVERVDELDDPKILTAIFEIMMSATQEALATEKNS